MSFRKGDIVEDIIYPGCRLVVAAVYEFSLVVAEEETSFMAIGHIDRYRIVEPTQPSVAYLELFQ